MPKTPIEMLDAVLMLGEEALVAYQNPAYGSGMNANAAGGIFSNLISRHGITPATLNELRATLAPIGVILAEEYTGTEEAALDMIAKLKAAHPTLFSTPDPPDVTGLNEEIALLKAELKITHEAAAAQIDRMLANSIAEDGSVPPVPDGATTFTPTHALVSAMVDINRTLLSANLGGEDLGQAEISRLGELIFDAFNINSEIKAMSDTMAAALDDEDDDEPTVFTAGDKRELFGDMPEGRAGFTPRTEPTVIQPAAFDDVPEGTVIHPNADPEEDDDVSEAEAAKAPITRPEPRKDNSRAGRSRGNRGRGR